MPSEMSEQRSMSNPAIELPPTSSNRTSKNHSPTRSSRKSSIVGQENRKDVGSHTSPTRPLNGNSPLPSAAAVQRALSVARSVATNNDSSSDAARDRKHRSGQNAPQWPTSPRLKSPPPSAAFRSLVGKLNENENQTSNGLVKKNIAAASTESATANQATSDASKETGQSQPSMRPPGRGISAQTFNLATVAENSVPSTPSMTAMPETRDQSRLQLPSLEPNSDTTAEPFTSKDAAKNASTDTTQKLVTDKAETAPSSRATSTSRATANLAKRSFTTLTGKSKPAVEPLRTITLETETVSSNPPLITDRGREGASVRTKPSNETIRPKKEKKKASRKTPSLHAGMNSSKADIFEAKVASAVGDADSSDSEETFVYESNPPDSRQARHHSRTPSANSVVSQADHHGTRGKHNVRGNNSVVGGKKSMKFSNSIYGNQLEAEGAGDGRSSTRTTTSNTPKYHHIGRHGRNGYASIMDADSTFTQANRGSSPRTPTTRNSRPSSPRTSNGRLHFARKSNVSGYDAYDEAADDERAPLIGSVRINRNRHVRRPNSSHLRALHFAEDEDPGCWPRYRGCILIGFIITLVFVAVTFFVIVINKGLEDVKILRIENVLASEQELMVDLRVQAVNPNFFTITVSDLDVNLFAESPYVGSTAEWESQPHSRRMSLTQRRQKLSVAQRKSSSWFSPLFPDGDGWFGGGGGDNDDDDPSDDPIAPGSQKMLLGRIFEFDSPLTFASAAFSHTPGSSVGEIRLMKPGNITETGGSERWNRILEHPFTLIARGVLKYQLPLSSITRSAKVGSRISVTPNNSSSDGNDNSTITFSVGR